LVVRASGHSRRNALTIGSMATGVAWIKAMRGDAICRGMSEPQKDRVFYMY
jgi:hypothetical protein